MARGEQEGRRLGASQKIAEPFLASVRAQDFPDRPLHRRFEARLRELVDQVLTGLLRRRIILVLRTKRYNGLGSRPPPPPGAHKPPGIVLMILQILEGSPDWSATDVQLGVRCAGVS